MIHLQCTLYITSTHPFFCIHVIEKESPVVHYHQKFTFDKCNFGGGSIVVDTNGGTTPMEIDDMDENCTVPSRTVSSEGTLPDGSEGGLQTKMDGISTDDESSYYSYSDLEDDDEGRDA